jgi:NAD(P)-dependent dehydrogenase (short-subunit alcohol dehydrogenase family)
MANIVVTGASRGIALEIARQAAATGDRVFATCRDPAGAAALNALAAASGGRLTVHRMDVRSDDSVRAAAAEIDAPTIDIVYNVAGILGPTKPELELGASDWEAWSEVFNTMTLGPLRVLQAFLPRMGPGSKAISITSQLAASTWPVGGYYAYGAAKAGLNRLMRSVSIDLKSRGIIVGVIHPGWVRTEMSTPNADLSPEESAEGIRKVTANWTLEKTGAFYKWNGEPHPL